METTKCVCGSKRFMTIDMTCGCLKITLDGEDYDDERYLPKEVNLGSGRELWIDICAECGRLPGKWPLLPRAHLLVKEREEREEKEREEKEAKEHFDKYGMNSFDRMTLLHNQYIESLQIEAENREKNKRFIERQYAFGAPAIPMNQMEIPQITTMNIPPLTKQ